MKRTILSVLISFASILSFSQDSTIIHLTLKKIRQQQIISDSYFLPGIFPSYISKKQRYSEKQKDNNVFYNALIGYTLHSLRPMLSASDKLIADSIAQKNLQLFLKFKNKNGRNTYNFSRTDTTFTFPYSTWISKLRKNLEFPDDLDCTSLILICQNVSDSTAEQAHQLMQNYINNGKLKTTFRSYRKYPAYSSWYGKKFPVVFDVSVLCNVLCFVQEHNLKWTAADSASLQLIVKTIKDKNYKKHSLFVSPYYGSTSLILYHLGRLMSVKPIAELEELKPVLTEEAYRRSETSQNELEKIMLRSTLMKWDYKQPGNVSLKEYEELSKKIHNNDLAFFVGNIPSYKKQPTKELLTDMKVLQYYYYCNAFNDALLLEYLVLKGKNK